MAGDTQRIAIINQKGGVGKTTISANLGHALALEGRRVMVVDLDPQGQLSPSLGLFRCPRQGVDETLLGTSTLTDVALSTREGMMLVPAGERLAEVERVQEGGIGRARLLQQTLQQAPPEQDYVLFDCPPSSGLLMANAVMAVDMALIPVTGDYLGLNGLAHLLKTLKRFEPIRGGPLQLRVVLSRLNPRRRLAREVVEKLSRYFPGQVLATPIQEAAVLAECPGAGRTIFEYRPKSRSARDFKALAKNLLEEGIQS